MGEGWSVSQAQAEVKVLWVSWTEPNYLQQMSFYIYYLTEQLQESLHSMSPPEDGNMMQQWKFKLVWSVNPPWTAGAH